MAIRRIVLYPDPILLKPTRPVEAVTEDVRELVRDMIETMHSAPGVGLAANQLGESLRVCVVDPSAGEREGELQVFINPKILKTEGSQVDEEGCLSFPEIVLEIERAEKATVEALDLEGRPFSFTGEGLMARVMLHEIEHLEGQVFLRNVSSVRRELVKRRIRKMMKSGDWVPAVAP